MRISRLIPQRCAAKFGSDGSLGGAPAHIWAAGDPPPEYAAGLQKRAFIRVKFSNPSGRRGELRKRVRVRNRRWAARRRLNCCGPRTALNNLEPEIYNNDAGDLLYQVLNGTLSDEPDRTSSGCAAPSATFARSSTTTGITGKLLCCLAAPRATLNIRRTICRPGIVRCWRKCSPSWGCQNRWLARRPGWPVARTCSRKLATCASTITFSTFRVIPGLASPLAYRAKFRRRN